MVVRYDPGYDHDNNPFDLELVDYTTPNNNDPILGKLSSLIQWHYDDPVDDFEINRNEIIFQYQENRNPFIDYPNLVNFLWGESLGQNWNENLDLENNELNNLLIFPNPSTGTLNFNQIPNNYLIEIFSSKGNKVYESQIKNLNSINTNLEAGVFILKVSNDKGIISKKIIIK